MYAFMCVCVLVCILNVRIPIIWKSCAPFPRDFSVRSIFLVETCVFYIHMCLWFSFVFFSWCQKISTSKVASLSFRTSLDGKYFWRVSHLTIDDNRQEFSHQFSFFFILLLLFLSFVSPSLFLFYTYTCDYTTKLLPNIKCFCLH